MLPCFATLICYSVCYLALLSCFATLFIVASVFTKIIAGELPGHFVWKDDLCVAFMSINPITRGHTLVVPKQETDHWINLSPELAAHLMEVARKIGIAQQAAFKPERIGLIVAGYEVPHTHIHVLPTYSMSDFSFARATTHVEPEELAQTATTIQRHLDEHANTSS